MAEPNEQGTDTMVAEKAIWNQLVEESGVVVTPETTTETPVTTETPASTETVKPIIETPVSTSGNDITDEVRLREINTLWGSEFKSLDEFKAKKAELDELPTYKTKVEELSKTPPKRYAAAVVEELNTFIAATGIEDVRVSKELKRFEATAEKTPIEAMVLAEIIKKPSLIDDKETLRDFILSKYNTYIDPDLEGEDLIKEQKRVKLVEFQMKQDAEAAYQAIGGLNEKITNYKDPDSLSQEQTKQKSEQTKAQWSEIMNKTGKDIFKSHEIQVPWGKDKDGKEVFKTIDTIELTPKQQTEAIDSIVELAAANNFELTNENLQSLINAKKELMTFNLGRESFYKFYANSLAQEKLNWEKGIHNPSSTQIELPTDTNTSTKSFEDAFTEAGKKVFGS